MSISCLGYSLYYFSSICTLAMALSTLTSILYVVWTSCSSGYWLNKSYCEISYPFESSCPLHLMLIPLELEIVIFSFLVDSYAQVQSNDWTVELRQILQFSTVLIDRRMNSSTFHNKSTIIIQARWYVGYKCTAWLLISVAMKVYIDKFYIEIEQLNTSTINLSYCWAVGMRSIVAVW